MATFSQTTLSNPFSWMKILEFRLKIHWNLFLRVLSTIFQHWFWWWLGADQATSHNLKQCWLDHWRIYASLGLSELMTRLPHARIRHRALLNTYLIGTRPTRARIFISLSESIAFHTTSYICFSTGSCNRSLPDGTTVWSNVDPMPLRSWWSIPLHVSG